MTKDEALKLTLEFANDIQRGKYKGNSETIIATIKAALEASDEPVAIYGYCPVCGAKGTSRERHPDGNTTCVNGHKYKSRDTLSAPPKQEAKDEPVAWMYEVNHAHTCLDLFEPPDDAYDEGTLHPLYTTPPQRTWVGLTDEEFKDAINGKLTPECIALAVEAKLKEKNDYA